MKLPCTRINEYGKTEGLMILLKGDCYAMNIYENFESLKELLETYKLKRSDLTAFWYC